MSIATIVILAAVALLVWKWGPRRPQEPGFRFVYVNQDGSVRELSPGEQAYLSGGHGGRPYIKASYESRDGWGSRSGFLARRRVPSRIEILAVNPDYDAEVKDLKEDPSEYSLVAGDTMAKDADGSIICTPNPGVSRKARFEIVRQHHLAQERHREELGLPHEYR